MSGFHDSISALRELLETYCLVNLYHNLASNKTSASCSIQVDNRQEEEVNNVIGFYIALNIFLK
jgi:hypothetical protein